jgi:hypothetical protein
MFISHFYSTAKNEIPSVFLIVHKNVKKIVESISVPWHCASSGMWLRYKALNINFETRGQLHKAVYDVG